MTMLFIATYLVLTLKNCIEPPSYASAAYVVAIWPPFLFYSFVKNMGHLREFFGQMVYAPPPPPRQKIFRTPMHVTYKIVCHILNILNLQ